MGPSTKLPISEERKRKLKPSRVRFAKHYPTHSWPRRSFHPPRHISEEAAYNWATTEIRQLVPSHVNKYGTLRIPRLQNEKLYEYNGDIFNRSALLYLLLRRRLKDTNVKKVEYGPKK